MHLNNIETKISTQLPRLLVATLVTCSLLSCGKKSKSEQGQAAIIPTQPIVQRASFTYSNHGTDVTVTGPWFSFSVKFKNNSTSETITIVGMTVEITGVNASGQFVTASSDYSASQSNFSYDGGECNYISFGEFAPGETGILGKTATSGIASPCILTGIIFYSSGNPDPGKDTLNFTYQGKIRLSGWFGKYTNPGDRFDKTIYFTTR